jgi:ComF family protein
MKRFSGLPIAGRLLTTLLPPYCRLCGVAVGHGLALCPGCQHDLPWSERACRQCGRWLGAFSDNPLCGRCQRHPPVFTATTAALYYRPPVDYLVQRLKFYGELALAPLLAALLAEKLRKRTPPLPGLLIPVPIHRARLRERGFNQATEIARALVRHLDLRLDRQLCRRIRRTGTQSLLPVDSRRGNVRNAFAVDGTPGATHVAIIDDVMTSGHTANELARVLKRAGVETVEVWVIARAGG